MRSLFEGSIIRRRTAIIPRSFIASVVQFFGLVMLTM
jgi:hypothetical protein